MRVVDLRTIGTVPYVETALWKQETPQFAGERHRGDFAGTAVGLSHVHRLRALYAVGLRLALFDSGRNDVPGGVNDDNIEGSCRPQVLVVPSGCRVCA